MKQYSSKNEFSIKRISPQFRVADIERSLAFYSNVLGFELDFRYEDFYAGIIKDGCSLHLKLGKSLMADGNNKVDQHLDLVISVDDIEELYKQFSNKQIRFVQPLRTMPYGKEFYITDPDGHVIGFVAASKG